jgi:hypothetical protein
MTIFTPTLGEEIACRFRSHNNPRAKPCNVPRTLRHIIRNMKVVKTIIGRPMETERRVVNPDAIHEWPIPSVPSSMAFRGNSSSTWTKPSVQIRATTEKFASLRQSIDWNLGFQSHTIGTQNIPHSSHVSGPMGFVASRWRSSTASQLIES